MKRIIGGLFGISVNTQGTTCPEDCPLVQAGLVTGHRFHCEDYSNEQIAQTMNGLTCLVLSIHRDLVQENQKLNQSINNLESLIEDRFKTVRVRIFNLGKELKNSDIPESSKSKVQKPYDNSLLLSIQSDIGDLEKSVEQIQSGLTSKIKLLFNSLSNDVLREVKTAISKNSLSQNSTLTELATEIEGLVKELKFDPDNPKPVEIKTQENSVEILRLNKKVIPMIEKASNAISKSNDMLEQTIDTLTLVKKKLGFDDIDDN